MMWFPLGVLGYVLASRWVKSPLPLTYILLGPISIVIVGVMSGVWFLCDFDFTIRSPKIQKFKNWAAGQ